MTMTAKRSKYKHGQQIIKYTMTDFGTVRDGIAHDSYIHPTISVSVGVVSDALEDYRRYGGRSYLDRAERLRAETGNTLHVDCHMIGREDITIRWQSDRQSADTPRGWCYQWWYGCRIDSMAFDADSVALLAKLLKACKAIEPHCHVANGVSPKTVLAGLDQIGAVRVVWSRESDSWVFTRAAADSWFGLSPEIRQGYVAPVEADAVA